MAYLLGIDIGTHESKGVLVSAEGRVVAAAAVGHETATPHPGWAEHDADGVWWHDLVSLTRELLARSGVEPREIDGIGCSAIGPCVLPVDGAGRPLRPAILYGIDTRASAEVEFLTRRLGHEWVLGATGSALSSQAAGPKILWIRRHEPEVWTRTRRVMTATSYLVQRLTGRVVMDHYTAAAYGPLYNLHARDWDPAGLELVCDRAMLPELDWSAAVAGRVGADAARETGLLAGTPVIVGTADAAAEATAAGVHDPGDTMVMYGSSMFFIQVCVGLPSSTLQWPSTYLRSDTYALAGGMSTTGALLTWFRDAFLPAPPADAAPDDRFETLAREAARIPAGSDGLLALPYFSGERTPLNDPQARGVVLGLGLWHTRGHVYRALMEGIAYGVRQNLEAMEAAGARPDRLVAIGGGTRSDLWVQIVSDVTGRAQQVQRSPGAALGNAMLAASAVGIVGDLRQTRAWVDDGPVVQPDPGAHEHYERQYPLFRALYRDTAPLAHAVATTASGMAATDQPVPDRTPGAAP